MSTLRSSPPTSNPRFTNHTNGFNEHSYYDPFFAAPADDEQLVQISSHTSPDSQLYTNPSSSPSKHSRHTSLAPEAQDYSQYPSSDNYSHHSLHPSASPLHSSTNGYATEPALLSPTAFYASDNGYELSDHSGTPDHGNPFDVDDDFTFLTDQANDIDPSHWSEPIDSESPAATHCDTNHSQEPSSAHPTSASTVSHASHLMSPALTDNPSPASRDGRATPSTDQQPARAGLFDNVVTSYARADQSSQNSSRGQGHMLQTPTLTGSSIDTSPERPTAATLAGAPSPIFRIESYSRGDSPNRPTIQLGRNSSKRSRSSSHLAVEQDGDSSEEEVEPEHRHNSGTTIIPEDSRTGRPLTPGRAGVNPQARLELGDTEVPNLKEQTETQNVALKNADVEDWLAHSNTGGDAGATLSPPPRPKATGRRRAKSAGERTLTHENLMTLGNAPPSAADMHIPGPGLYINEDSGDDAWDMDEEDQEEEEAEDDDGIPETPPATIGIEDVAGNASEAHAERQLGSPPLLYRAHLWQDPLYDSTSPGPHVKMQPVTANDAISRYHQRSRDLETLSRAATWGTRRMSESDLEGLFHRLSFKISEDGKDKVDRRGSFLEAAAAKLRPKRSLSRRKETDPNKQQAHRPSIAEQKKMDSTGSRKETLLVPSPQRRPSLGKRPRIHTGSAVAAIAGQMAAVGAGKGGPATATASSPSGSWKNVIRRNRSRSDLQLDRSSGNLTDLWTKHGGPPMPTLAAPGTPPKEEDKGALANDVAELEEDEEDEAIDDKGVTIDLSIRADPITPTMEGFRLHVRQLNPRLPPFLVERVAQEQLKRYKKLVVFKVEHAQSLATGKCSSGKHCLELGGEPTYLPSKSGGKEAGEESAAKFAITNIGQSEDDANALAEGVVTPAQFPPGVPMPPVKRLPAEFECSLCFKVKKFHKPSDWSKHVHEDIQPFTCTFHSCPEPKSFKRKADWVRHENERHRQLEWWMCNMHDCAHRCYRKDNFVQHLVREHKLPEPKVKTTKAGTPAVRGPSTQKTRAMKGDPDDSAEEPDQVWKLVDECRHETPKNPKDEPCKFCGNICNSWKKLTVHLAKHMEQISMPVLGLVKSKEVTAETIISPVEQRAAQNTGTSPIGPAPFPQNPSFPSSLRSISPYGNIARPTASPMGDLSGSFNAAQAGFYDNVPVSRFQREQASTYPQPQQHPQSSYLSSRGTPYPMMTGYSYDSTPGSNQYDSFNQSSRGAFQYSPPSSSPDNLYGGMSLPPTSQPRTIPFMHQQPTTYPSSTTYPQQGQYSTAPDNTDYRYSGSNQTSSITGLSQGLPSQSMGAQAPTYGQNGDLNMPQTSLGDGVLYGQQGHNGEQGYGY
ncbi:MAG: hypothetical protein Q9219_002900 [cf. Caloplaca sp. 3 TL-2023]